MLLHFLQPNLQLLYFSFRWSEVTHIVFIVHALHLLVAVLLVLRAWRPFLFYLGFIQRLVEVPFRGIIVIAFGKLLLVTEHAFHFCFYNWLVLLRWLRARLVLIVCYLLLHLFVLFFVHESVDQFAGSREAFQASHLIHSIVCFHSFPPASFCAFCEHTLGSSFRIENWIYAQESFVQCFVETFVTCLVCKWLVVLLLLLREFEF